MLLSKENAIQNWREVIGPANPEKAKNENPNS
jgi:nucleoside diphosphate kinase